MLQPHIAQELANADFDIRKLQVFFAEGEAALKRR